MPQFGVIDIPDKKLTHRDIHMTRGHGDVIERHRKRIKGTQIERLFTFHNTNIVVLIILSDMKVVRKNV